MKIYIFPILLLKINDLRNVKNEILSTETAKIVDQTENRPD